jgi:hypothetical protein
MYWWVCEPIKMEDAAQEHGLAVVATPEEAALT